MSANFVALTATTPDLADGTLVEVQISQAASDWLLSVMRQSHQHQKTERLRQDRLC